MNYVLFYEAAADVLSTAPTHFPAHSARLEEWRARGELLLVGPFEDPREGSMSVFTTRESAADFVRDDPFVLNGVVAGWKIRGWDADVAVPADA